VNYLSVFLLLVLSSSSDCFLVAAHESIRGFNSPTTLSKATIATAIPTGVRDECIEIGCHAIIAAAPVLLLIACCAVDIMS
jgi:hypothetical protein